MKNTLETIRPKFGSPMAESCGLDPTVRRLGSFRNFAVSSHHHTIAFHPNLHPSARLPRRCRARSLRRSKLEPSLINYRDRRAFDSPRSKKTSKLGVSAKFSNRQSARAFTGLVRSPLGWGSIGLARLGRSPRAVDQYPPSCLTRVFILCPLQ